MASPMLSKAMAEFVGTFLLVFTVGCNVLNGNAVWGPVAIASVLMICIYALGGVSGANFNPAVSIALGITKALGGPGLDCQAVIIYCFSQVLGGLAAGLAYVALHHGYAFTLGPSSGFSILAAYLCECFYTFMLTFVVLNVAVAKKNKTEGTQFFGLAIGFVIVAGAYGAGAVSGGCFNPAVAIGVSVFQAVNQGFRMLLFYIAAEVQGAILAAGLFVLVRPDDFPGMKPVLSAPLKVFCCEFIGAFMLCLTVGLNVFAKSPAGAFSIAASLMCMVYALGDVSGAHFNPAVTIAVLLTGLVKSLTTPLATGYIIAQVLGGLTAGYVCSSIYAGRKLHIGPDGNDHWGGLEPPQSSTSKRLHIGPDHNSQWGWGEVATAEIIFTFVLCYVVICVAVAGRTKSTQFFGLAIGSCVTVGGLAIGGISGGLLNPAVAIGIGVTTDPVNALIYSALQICGAILAVLVVMVTHADDPKSKEDDDGESGEQNRLVSRPKAAASSNYTEESTTVTTTVKSTSAAKSTHESVEDHRARMAASAHRGRNQAAPIVMEDHEVDAPAKPGGELGGRLAAVGRADTTHLMGSTGAPTQKKPS